MKQGGFGPPEISCGGGLDNPWLGGGASDVKDLDVDCVISWERRRLAAEIEQSLCFTESHLFEGSFWLLMEVYKHCYQYGEADETCSTRCKNSRRNCGRNPATFPVPPEMPPSSAQHPPKQRIPVRENKRSQFAAWAPTNSLNHCTGD
ncbi:hypothetical protein Cantr_05658 [Candida viswanathii]|uniref:Uncharacterized protein n=1 Tax=Candida viswanathii TaxID=5486 RepID=A0A367XRW3_9ASCO|nr:hypothetical protein Cantr_05658 [Candida viswanathii]